MIDFKNKAIIKLSRTDENIAEDTWPLFVEGELLVGVYKSLRDYVVFTSKRIISVNVKGITGKKKDFTSLPYSKIQSFSVETAGTLDLDCELQLWFSGLGLVKFEFTGSSNILEIGQIIGNAVL